MKKGKEHTPQVVNQPKSKAADQAAVDLGSREFQFRDHRPETAQLKTLQSLAQSYVALNSNGAMHTDQPVQRQIIIEEVDEPERTALGILKILWARRVPIAGGKYVGLVKKLLEQWESEDRPFDSIDSLIASLNEASIGWERGAESRRTRVAISEEGTSQKHHPKYIATTHQGDTETLSTVHVDDVLVTGKRTMEAEKPPELKAVLLKKILNTWDGSTSLVSQFISDYYSHVMPTDDTADFDPLMHSDITAERIALIMAAHRNMKLRERDIAGDCPDVQVEINDKSKRGTELKTVRIDYALLLQDARKDLKALLLAKAPAPESHHEIDLIKEKVLTSAATAELRSYGGLKDTGTLNKKAIRDGNITYKTSDIDRERTFNFGLGHLRMAIYLDWKIATRELGL